MLPIYRRRISRIWSITKSTIYLTFLTNVPVLWYLNVRSKGLAFQTFTYFVMIAAILVGGFTFHGVLRLSNRPSNLRGILAVYSIPQLIFMPVISVLSIPALYYHYQSLESLRDVLKSLDTVHPLAVRLVIAFFFVLFADTRLTTQLLGLLTGFVALGMQVMLLEILGHVYQTSRSKTYLAGVLALAISAVVVAISTTPARDLIILHGESMNSYGVAVHRKVDASQQADGAVALVFMIAGDSRVNAGHRRQVRCRHADRLHARLLVMGRDRDRRLRSLLQQLDLAIDAQHLGHFLRELGIAAFQVVAHLVRLHLASIEYLADGSLRQIGQASVLGHRPVLARVLRQQPRRYTNPTEKVPQPCCRWSRTCSRAPKKEATLGPFACCCCADLSVPITSLQYIISLVCQ